MALEDPVEDPLAIHKLEHENHYSGNSSSQSNINRKICRTCLKAVDTGRTSFYNIDTVVPPAVSSVITTRQKLAVCLPELELDLIPDAIICGFCSASLHWAYEFRQRCRKTEEIIYEYVLQEVENDTDHIELEKIVAFNNDKAEKKLECVEILVNDDNTEWDYVNFTCINPSYKTEVNIKKEPLMGKDEVAETSEENFSDEMEGNNECNMKFEEIQVKDELHSIDAKLNGDDIPKVNNGVEHERIEINRLVPFSPEDNAYECNECRVRFALKCDYRLHKIFHAQNLKPYECDECGFSTPNQNTLRRHLLVSHTKELKCQCRGCGIEIFDLDNHDVVVCEQKNINHTNPSKRPKLEDLTIKSRTNNGLFKCSLCDYRGTSETMLLNHKKTHEESMHYTCHICLKPFKDVLDLSRHLIVHSDINN